MLLNIIATVVLLWWLAQGAKLVLMTWSGGYSFLWVVAQSILTLLLIIPAIAIWL